MIFPSTHAKMSSPFGMPSSRRRPEKSIWPGVVKVPSMSKTMPLTMPPSPDACAKCKIFGSSMSLLHCNNRSSGGGTFAVAAEEGDFDDSRLLVAVGSGVMRLGFDSPAAVTVFRITY